MKRLLIIAFLAVSTYLVQAQTGVGWKYTPLLQTDVTTVSNYLKVNLGTVRLNNPVVEGQIIQAKYVNGQLVFQNQEADFEQYLIKKAGLIVFRGLKVDGVTIVMNPADSVISAVIPPQRAGVDSIFTIGHPILPIDYLMYTKNSLNYNPAVIPRPVGLFAGGLVTWVDSLRFSVSPAAYFIDGKLHVTENTSLELSPSDATYGRIDLIVLDTLSHVTIIEGTPAENPQKPVADPLSQLELTQVLILPNAVTPGQPGVITDQVIYDENTEWATSAQGVSVNFTASTPVAPFHGSVYASVATIGLMDEIRFTSPQPLNVADYQTLSFALRLKATVSSRHFLFVEFYLDGVRVAGPATQSFTRNDVTSWQNLVTPLNALTFTATTFDQVRLSWMKTGTVADYTGFYLDYMKLQAGISQPVPQGEVELVGDVTGRGTGSIVTTVGNDSHNHTITTLPTLISSLDGVANDGGNIDLIAGNNILLTPDDATNTIGIAVLPLDTADIGGLTQFVTNRLENIEIDTTQVAGLNEYITNRLELGVIDTTDVLGLDQFVLDRIPEFSIDTTDVAGLNEYITNRLDDIQITTTQVTDLDQYITNRLENLPIDTTDVGGLNEFVLDRIPTSAQVDTSGVIGLNEYVMDRLPDTHPPVTINPASSAYASITGQVLTINPQTGANLSVQALSGTSPAWNAASGINATLTLTGNTIITLSNLAAGTSGNITVINASTAYTLTFSGYTNRISPAVFSATNVVKTSGSSKTDCYSWYYDGTRLIWNGTLDYN